MFAFLEDEGSLSPETAFAVFLKWVEGGPGPTDEPTASAPWARLLHAAAVGGVQQARALIFRYYEFHGYEINEDIRSKVLDWNLESIATGALVFSSEVRAMDGPRFDAALKLFQESGGFNQHYSGVSPQILQEYLPPSIPLSSKSLYEPLNRWGDCLPHILASFNHSEAINTLKTIMTRECVDMRNKFGETPLYRACECGASKTVIFLLEMGANPSLPSRRNGPSCLHWLFAFHPDHIDMVARKLIEKGASTNTLTNQREKMFHYPFMLPTGSPLHWAVRFGCTEAVRALLSHGADPFLRDSDRQFIFVSSDPDVRPDSPDDVPHEEFILGPSAGSSAVDLAVQNWNADILEVLLEGGSGVRDDTAADGIGVPHHLIAGDFCWISDCSPSRFYTPYVRGSLETQRAMLKRTLQVLCQYGFEIDSLAAAWRSGKTSTVLMLAVYAGKIDLVELLLEAGADVNTADSDGRTALMYMGVRYGVEYSGELLGQEEFQTRVAKLLLSHGADIHVRDRQGYSPVLVLASHYLRAAVKVLLDNGAAADDKIACAETNRDDVADFPVFGHLAWALSDKLDEDKESATQAHDTEMAAMLQTYVVPLLAARREGPDRGITYRELDRHALLHELAICGLIESATVVLRAGADVNPVTTRLGKPPRTPLDALLNFINSLARKGSRGMSKAEAETRDRRYERTVALLGRYGALQAHELEARTSSSSRMRDLLTGYA
ncbi:ankyrin repeat-containing domain protein [Ustulina deusta]|nr:ankyrin repeat-containing domain protein [Ustulina deusta]